LAVDLQAVHLITSYSQMWRST